MAAGGWEWDIPYTTTSLSYIEKWKSELIRLAQTPFIGATDNSIALAVAGAITREQRGGTEGGEQGTGNVIGEF